MDRGWWKWRHRTWDTTPNSYIFKLLGGVSYILYAAVFTFLPPFLHALWNFTNIPIGQRTVWLAILFSSLALLHKHATVNCMECLESSLCFPGLGYYLLQFSGEGEHYQGSRLWCKKSESAWKLLFQVLLLSNMWYITFSLQGHCNLLLLILIFVVSVLASLMVVPTAFYSYKRDEDILEDCSIDTITSKQKIVQFLKLLSYFPLLL